jgi:ABC-2 type transport system ATP-binding protein
MPSEPAIEAIGLEKAFGSVRVLNGIDLQVPQGSVFALLGPNGAGKTTMVRILATLLRADRGSARVAGHDVVRDRSMVRRQISLTGQYVSVDELQTGAENLRMMSRLAGLGGAAARGRAESLLAQFDLTDAGNRQVKTYSGGMRRRLDLAASLCGQPSVIFLDEPTTGLDLRSRQTMWEIIVGLTRTGMTIFLTTQYLEEADRLADRIALLDNGTIVANDSPAALKKWVAQNRLDMVMVDVASFEALAAALGDRAIVKDQDRLTLSVATDGSARQVRHLLDEFDPQRAAIKSFAIHSATLDDVFLALTGRPARTAAQVGKDAQVA